MLLNPNFYSWLFDVLKKAWQKSVTNKFLIATGTGIFGSLVRWVSITFYRKITYTPPGLIGYPLLGSVYPALTSSHQFLYKISPSYGPICYYEAGAVTTYCINDHMLVQKLFSSKLCDNRPTLFTDVYDDDKYRHMVPSFADVNDDKLWSKRRRYMLNSIVSIANRAFIVKQVKVLLNKYMYDEIDRRINCERKDDREWYPREDVRHAAFNIVFGAIFGDNAQIPKNEEFNTFSKLIHQSFDAAEGAMLPYCFPLFGLGKYIFRRQTDTYMLAWVKCYEMIKKYTDIAEKDYYEKVKNNNDDNQKRTYFDELFEQVLNDQKDRQNSKNPNENENENDDCVTTEMLVVDVFTMLSASMDTTGTTMEYALLLAAKHPSIQGEIYDELRQCVVKTEAKHDDDHDDGGKIKLEFDLSRITQCPKFRAFVFESLRLACAAVRGVAHSLIEDCQLSYDIDKQTGQCCNIRLQRLSQLKSNSEKDTKTFGAGKKGEFKYILKRDALVEPNLAYIVRGNDKLWGKKDGTGSNGIKMKATDLDLDNWLKYGYDNQGNKKIVFQNNPMSMPFSYGGRDCPGKSLAQKELFAFLANLFLNYQFDFQDVNTEIRYVESFVTVIEPQIPLIVSRRND